jgi:TorA maturation chaperone TorD
MCGNGDGESAFPAAPGLDEVAASRGDSYALLASLLWRAPDSAMLQRLAVPPTAQGELAKARAALAEAAASADPVAVAREHFALFIGVGGSELTPYASYYLTGFLHERPLADLRADLRRLGLSAAPGLGEPEDHLAFLCEVMAALIRGGNIAAIDEAAFFARHLQPWARRCFHDMENCPSARFYRPVGRLGRLIMEIEADAFVLPESAATNFAGVGSNER